MPFKQPIKWIDTDPVSVAISIVVCGAWNAPQITIDAATKTWLLTGMIAYRGMLLVRKTHPTMLN
jgi:hypothetical protein